MLAAALDLNCPNTARNRRGSTNDHWRTTTTAAGTMQRARNPDTDRNDTGRKDRRPSMLSTTAAVHNATRINDDYRNGYHHRAHNDHGRNHTTPEDHEAHLAGPWDVHDSRGAAGRAAPGGTRDDNRAATNAMSAADTYP